MPHSLSEIDYSECIKGNIVFTTVDGKHFIESNGTTGDKSIRRYGQIRNCVYCKNSFFARNDSIKRGNASFCSRECSSKFNTTRHIIDRDTLKNLYENSDLTRSEIEQELGISNATLTRLINEYGLTHRHRKRAPPQILICSNCGCKFERANYLVERFKGKFKNIFCSFKCKGEYQRKTRDNKKRVTVTCSWCGNPHERVVSRVADNNYCCVECQHKHMGYLKRDRVETSCYVCGKSISLKKCQVNYRNFCSRECVGKQSSIDQRGEKCHFWRGGISFEPYLPEFNTELKRFIRERDQFTCQLCGITEELVGQKLDVHHIDYDKTNNEVINLISLCKSCHSKTNFKRDDWMNLFNSINEVILFQD